MSAWLQVSNAFGNLAVVCSGQMIFRKLDQRVVQLPLKVLPGVLPPSWFLLEPPELERGWPQFQEVDGKGGKRVNCPSRRTPESQDQI